MTRKSSTTGRGTDRERCEESASVKGGTGRRRCATKEPKRAWITGGRREGDTDYKSGLVNSSFNLILTRVLTVDGEHDFAKMIAGGEETSWRIRERIRVR